jgi:RNA polymerase sigma-70 factor (ECF subfamily)
MSVGDSEAELVRKAQDGDRVALQRLLLVHSSQLSSHIAPKVPASVQGVLGVDDLMQDTFMEVLRDISRYEPRTHGSFLAWLKGVADHRIQDAVKTLNRIKRGGDRVQVRQVASASQSRSVADLIDMLSARSHTPSSSAARHEAIQAVENAINDLPADYRQAVQLRLVEGRSLEEVASAMDRTPRAVQGLIDRAKKKMRAALARLSL